MHCKRSGLQFALWSVAGLFLAIVVGYSPARGQEAPYVLRIHHYLPAKSVENVDWLTPWTRLLEQDSKGRLKIEIYPAMGLGGKPTDLYEQVRSGAVDMIWTITGYSPGKFPRLEVFELPWVASADAIRASAAAWEFYEKYARDEFNDVKLLAISTTGKGTLFMRDREAKRPADLARLTIRVPSPLVGQTVKDYGALPKAMAVPELASALTKGEIAGLVTPYRMISTNKLQHLVHHVTEFQGNEALYTSVYLIVMNKARYMSLPRDLRNIIDDRSGHRLSALLGWQIDLWEREAQRSVREGGAKVINIDGDELELWKAASADQISAWIAKRNAAGDDGRMLLEAVRRISETFR
jgi:TRAP-type C4-dicarboxylate transport system substrate-binding protein